MSTAQPKPAKTASNATNVEGSTSRATAPMRDLSVPARPETRWERRERLRREHDAAQAAREAARRDSASAPDPCADPDQDSAAGASILADLGVADADLPEQYAAASRYLLRLALGRAGRLMPRDTMAAARDAASVVRVLRNAEQTKREAAPSATDAADLMALINRLSSKHGEGEGTE